MPLDSVIVKVSHQQFGGFFGAVQFCPKNERDLP